jgi:imidazolonepropionase-like amidohydrolase
MTKTRVSTFAVAIAATILMSLGALPGGMLQDSGSTPVQPSAPTTLILVGGRILSAPDAMPIDDGVIVIDNGRIASVGPRATTAIPTGASSIDCKGLVITAAFQNSHVHFTNPHWLDAARQPVAPLNAQLEAMLTRYGFATVVDTASYFENTLALRRRIESGEVKGPRILTAGFALYPPDGVPYYVREETPPELLKLLQRPTTPRDATALVQRQITGGADIVKLFVGSWVERGKVLPMPQEIATAATAEAHRLGKLVFVHPSNGVGLEIALRAGVDVLAHAIDDTREITPDQWARMHRQNVALIPTMKLFGGRFAWDILDEVRDYTRNGGQILFGTDVGYLTDFDPTQEYEFMSAAGLSWREILASLTTNPAQRFGEASIRGRVAPGQAADLVVLGSDPISGPRAFADVRWTIRGGRVIYEARLRSK